MRSATITFTKVISAEVDLVTLAEVFWSLDDEAQAQFFIEVARIATAHCATYNTYPGMQWFSVGRHLRDCECSTPEARMMIDDIVGGLAS